MFVHSSYCFSLSELKFIFELWTFYRQLRYRISGSRMFSIEKFVSTYHRQGKTPPQSLQILGYIFFGTFFPLSSGILTKSFWFVIGNRKWKVETKCKKKWENGTILEEQINFTRHTGQSIFMWILKLLLCYAFWLAYTQFCFIQIGNWIYFFIYLNFIYQYSFTRSTYGRQFILIQKNKSNSLTLFCFSLFNI